MKRHCCIGGAARRSLAQQRRANSFHWAAAACGDDPKALGALKVCGQGVGHGAKHFDTGK